MASLPSRHFGDTLRMQVKNMGFLIDRLGEDCAPLQYIRELTQNAIEGIQALPNPTGEIRWDVDWNTYDLAAVHKLSIVDTGIGMTGPEMVDYINYLSSSAHVQTTSTNYGVGAKIAAAPRNQAGLVYLSWKDGTGYMIQLWRDPVTKEYGLRKFERPDGTADHWTFVDDDLKPQPIKKHGTMVVLFGNKEDEDTMAAPKGAAMPSRWVLRYLNGRYYRFPDGITAMAREGWTNPREDTRHNFLRQVTGMEPWLKRVSSAAGSVTLSGATAHWWVLKETVDVDAGHYLPGGHVAALYQDELYEVATGRTGTSRLQELGVIFGAGQVVIYVEPDASNGRRLTTNTARTQLILDGDRLPWSEWAAEFRERMPAEIAAYMDRLSAALAPDHRESIKERLRAIRDLFKFSRYRQVKHGAVLLEDLIPGGAGNGRTGGGGSGGTRSGSGGGRGNGPGGNIYALFQAPQGVPGAEIRNLIDPSVKWVTVEDNSRTAGDMEDRAAKYIPELHTLLVNADFRVFKDMVERWTQRYAGAPTARPLIESVVREWFEQQLVEAVLGAYALRPATSQWTSEDMKQLWSEEALTAVVLPRYHVEMNVKRMLGSKLGSLRDQSV